MSTSPLISKSLESEAPLGPPVPSVNLSILSKIYLIIYKDKGNLVERHFYFDGPFMNAIERCKTYCTNMRFRFVHCQPFLENLEEKEKQSAALGSW